jgi:2',3'-cyclic-nucleotide 2'-phosphodiesterase/3'-nucleotidase/5'-nucleotidase
LTVAAGNPSLSFAEARRSISLTPIGSVAAGSFLTSAAEIGAHDPLKQRLYVVNAQAVQIDVVDIANPAEPVLLDELAIDVTAFGGIANSVAVRDGLIAVAVEAFDKTQPGKVVFFDSDLVFIASVQVGSLPDMLTFTPNGRYVLVANEGEPSPDYLVDPEGSVSIIDLSAGPANATVRTAGFSAYNGLSRAALFNGAGSGPKPAIRVYGPGATVAQDIEPEYITVSQDSRTAWVTLQENNAIAVIDIATATVTSINGLGVKDHSLPGNALDASDRDGVPVANNGRINIRNWPVKGFFLPDAIASYQVGKETYLLLANEGDTRDWPGYGEETRVGSMALDSAVFPADVATELKKAGNLGRLKATTAQGDTNGNNIYKEIYTFGGRSFSVRSSTGALVWDSGDSFERITAEQNPAFFNSNHEINRFDDRSDDKGPEPEGIAVGKAFGRTYAFIGLERIGGVMVYDVSVPTSPQFVQYVNNRDFGQPTESPTAGDLGPEGLLFIAEENSPNGKPLLVVTNEVSGTTTIYEINK